MKYEFDKLLRQRKLFAIIVIVLIVVYVFLGFRGVSDTFCGISLDYFWENEEYRERVMSKKAEVVDEAYIENMKESYKAFVDANIMSKQEIEAHIAKKQAEGFQIDCTAEEALADPYNFDYAFAILNPEAYYSYEMEYTYLEAFKIYMPLSENPVQYMHDKYERANYFWENDTGETWWEYMGYSQVQEADYWNFIDSYYENIQLTTGYSLGWDVLCGVMQFLPYTLGMALIVIIGNIFSQEKIHHMKPIVCTTKKGRDVLLRRKSCVVFVVSTVLWLLFQIAILIAVAFTYTLQGSACTAMCFSEEPNLFGLSWMQYYMINCAFSYVGTLVFALFVCCMSSLLSLRLSLPVNLVITLLTGIPLNHFCYADKAFKIWDQVRALTPAQLMASYPTLQVYQSYEIGPVVVMLPYMMVVAMVGEILIMLWWLRRREGGK